jgi:hypothetical protein
MTARIMELQLDSALVVKLLRRAGWARIDDRAGGVAGQRDRSYDGVNARLAPFDRNRLAGTDGEDQLGRQLRRQKNLGSVFQDQPVNGAAWGQRVLCDTLPFTSVGSLGGVD